MDPIYVDLASESDDPSVTEIESLCMTCQGKGTTRLLMTSIPHFKEVILTSFCCNTCGYKNNGIEPGSIATSGIKYELKLLEIKDLSRQIVRSDKAFLRIPEIDLEISPQGKIGEITTIEGIISKVKNDLVLDQPERRITNEELAQQIEDFIARLDLLLRLEKPFTITIDDPSGNSFLENYNFPHPDEQMKISNYTRSKEQNEMLGMGLDTIQEEPLGMIEETDENTVNLKGEVLQFDTLCSNCSLNCITKMKVINIPHFKETIIMATDCEHCGYKSNEVKAGGGISEKGKKFNVFIECPEDLARDILKSETCSIAIPELEIEGGCGVLVGKFTTVEGILTDIKGTLSQNAFFVGDTSSDNVKQNMKTVLENLQKVIDGKKNVHLVLDDPAGNSYVQNLRSPEADPNLKEESYERTFDQNEELGLNDMKTENYEEGTNEDCVNKLSEESKSKEEKH